MFELKTLSRPLRRILAEWVGKLVDRLTHFRDQLRFGIVRMISSTVAETIEDQFHRTTQRKLPYQDDYDEDADYLSSSWDQSAHASQSRPDQQGNWFDILKHASSIVLRWIKGPWAEPILASVVTLISILLVVR